ncbi:Cof-type HAD-IIB family hydrolase [Fundicoccus culcitae]|uniref:Cof-type HAD-IIB family hydrolase n=1 Tax=Fundicoccus culcitae TaxID=2969821 RepID=A0ABY5PAD1_9LACT|nr:Cof-type HAD-IIB family hydrolase [Fundicoccus culcitae]UUX35400.1 Cof-type HAD-IIB family hydrolase [Fundicoccus culcitae]
MNKAVFIDVDGTIVSYEGELPQSAVTAIQKARANGHFVYMCTGRSKAEIYDDLWEIGFDGLIGGNGSYIEHHDEVVFEQTLTEEECRSIVDWCHARGLEFYVESNNGLFASEHFEEQGQSVMVEYSKRKHLPDAEEMSVRKAFPEMIFGGELVRSDVNKISFILSSYQDYLDAKEEFAHLMVNTWGGEGEIALFGDVGVAQINKGKSVQILLDHIQINRENTLAFGDAKIDIPMLEYCEIGVAMGNGGPEIKEMADYITDAVMDDGLYNAFEHFGLI